MRISFPSDFELLPNDSYTIFLIFARARYALSIQYSTLIKVERVQQSRESHKTYFT